MTEYVEVPGVKVVEHTLIPLADGIRLAARIWLPEDFAPVPAILEYVPYRKRGGLETRDEIMHRYIASHGYACVRVDLRGSGDSEGLLLNEYLPTELADGAEVIDWISRQPWCDGNVGIIGKSWGGFNGLQIAALRPPALKAVITVCSTDDRYADDIHHKGGTLLTENLTWGSTMFSFNSLPPDPELAGSGWRAAWMERLESNRPWIIEWLRHLTRDDFYRHGSVCEDFSRIETPVLAVGGWADSYTNAVFRLMAGLETPTRAVVGPWVHLYPHQGMPAPDIDFLSFCLRWWDQWLKGEVRRVLDEPRYRVFITDSARPAVDSALTPGRWVGLDVWPPRLLETWSLAPGRLAAGSEANLGIPVASPQSTGMSAGAFCPMWGGPDLPGDQRHDDARSVCFDTEPLSADVDVVGAPVLEIEVSADAPAANLVARLCEVFPDGTSARISWMPINLTHLEGEATVVPLEEGATYHLSVSLDDCAHRFAAGNRIRLALSTAYWPLVWPQPAAATVNLHTGRLLVPVAPAGLEDRGSSLGHGVGARPDPVILDRPEIHTRSTRSEDGLIVHEVLNDFGAERFASGLVRTTRSLDVYSIDDADPLSARVETRWSDGLARDDWSVQTDTVTTMTSTATHFRIEASLTARQGDQVVFERSWDESIPRLGT
jgi:uncharacterized protein